MAGASACTEYAVLPLINAHFNKKRLTPEAVAAIAALSKTASFRVTVQRYLTAAFIKKEIFEPLFSLIQDQYQGFVTFSPEHQIAILLLWKLSATLEDLIQLLQQSHCTYHELQAKLSEDLIYILMTRYDLFLLDASLGFPNFHGLDVSTFYRILFDVLVPKTNCPAFKAMYVDFLALPSKKQSFINYLIDKKIPEQRQHATAETDRLLINYLPSYRIR